MTQTVENEAENIWGYAKRLRFVREVIREAFTENRTVQVLDLGCGNGSQLAIPLAGDPRLEIVGIDPDLASINHARELATSTGNVKFICGNVKEFAPNRHFDVVILSEVLEHLEYPAEMLVTATRLLRRDGVLIVTVPNGYGEFEIDSWVFRALRLQKLVDALATKRELIGSTDNSESGHIQFFTRSRLRRLFRQTRLVAFTERAGSFLAGPIAGHFISRSRYLINLNARITDRLPLILASGWYFALRRQESASPVEANK
ncbi:MAG TPA: class I SAM-dependent methyltransferase [Pyrinomonadaceae bacterium]|nr:class I SAM-dependent methyltransferase [Pyrinomonadaceae bacterium]